MANTLLEQRDWAIENLLNAAVENDADVESLADEHRRWRDRVVARMEELGLSESDIRYFRVLGTFVYRTVDGIDDDHRHLKSIVMERCERLENIARRMEDASPSGPG